MFDSLDETLKNLLIKEIPITRSEIDILFDQPTGEWSARVVKPTLNLFLYDIQENRQLRGSEQFSKHALPDGRAEIRRNPARIDLTYLVTAWSKKEQDQHHLLGLALMALLRTPFLPEDVFAEGMISQPLPIPLTTAQADENRNWGEFWTTLNNKYRPGFTVKVTLLIDPYRPVISPMVQSAEVSIRQTDRSGNDEAIAGRYWMVKGEIKSTKYDPNALTLTWEERNTKIEIKDGQFSIPKVMAGTYHISVLIDDRILRRTKFTVPMGEQLSIEV